MSQLHLLHETHAKELRVIVRRKLQEIDPSPNHHMENVYEIGQRRGRQYRVRRVISPGCDHLFFDVSGLGASKKNLTVMELTVGEMKAVIALAKRLHRP